MKLSNFIQALAVLMGTIVGVGLFSLPYITARVGIWVMLGYFVVLSAVVVIIGWIYGEVVLRTEGLHRLPGYAKKYLGFWGEMAAFVAGGLGFIGALLAYLIIGGGFLALLLKPLLGGKEVFYILIFFAVGAFLVYKGVRSIAQTEFLLLVIFLVILVFVSNQAWPLIDTDQLFNFDAKFLFLPYGAVLFSLLGTSVIPEVVDILDNRKNGDLKKVILISTTAAALVYLVFIVVVLGVAGQGVSEDAISGLQGALGGKIVGMMFVFGVLTTFTSFLTLGEALKKMLWYDLKISKNLSWALTSFTPLILYFAGFDSFISIISVTGGVFAGTNIVLMILAYAKAKTKGDLLPAYSLNIPRFVLCSLVILFLVGVIYEIIYFVG